MKYIILGLFTFLFTSINAQQSINPIYAVCEVHTFDGDIHIGMIPMARGFSSPYRAHGILLDFESITNSEGQKFSKPDYLRTFSINKEGIFVDGLPSWQKTKHTVYYAKNVTESNDYLYREYDYEDGKLIVNKMVNEEYELSTEFPMFNSINEYFILENVEMIPMDQIQIINFCDDPNPEWLSLIEHSRKNPQDISEENQPIWYHEIINDTWLSTIYSGYFNNQDGYASSLKGLNNAMRFKKRPSQVIGGYPDNKN